MLAVLGLLESVLILPITCSHTALLPSLASCVPHCWLMADEEAQHGYATAVIILHHSETGVWERGREPLPRLWLVDSAWSRGSCSQSAEPSSAHYPLRWGKRPARIRAVRFSQKCYSIGEVRTVPIERRQAKTINLFFVCVCLLWE